MSSTFRKASTYLIGTPSRRRVGLVAVASLGFLSLLWGASRRTAIRTTFWQPSSTTAMMSANELAAFLGETKAKYLKAVEQGTAHQWTVVMGNEAGDLDSLASAIGYAWLSHTQRKHTPVVPLYQTSRADLHLRPENLHALKLAGLSDEHASLLCLSDLPAGPFPSSRFALVDHNILSPQFSSNTSSVVAIVDHHADEGRHTDADPREIAVPTGSCASLVANRIQAGANVSPPPSLAALLLATTVIDTQGLKPGGKAEAADRAAAAFLLPLSALLPASLDLVGNAERVHETPGLAELNEVLQTTKADVSGLGTRDILRRDYKEYTFSAVGGSLRVGLASVPISLLDWHTQIGEALGRDTEAWAAERGLDGLGVLTSFRDTDKLNKHGRPKHRREQLWLVRAGNLAPRLFAGLEANLELDLKPGSLAGITSFGGGWEARAYRQKNADASRKVTAPVVKAIIEEVTGDGSGQL